MKKIFSFLGALTLCLNSFAQQNYSFSTVPKNLLSRAGAVVRNSETSVEVKDADNVYYRVKEAITILNASADTEGNIDLFYDKDTQIKSVKGVIYNEFGVPVSKFSEKNFQDRSAVSNFSLYEDNRVKSFHPAQATYPYTIEYEYEIRRRQSLFFPDWLPIRSTGVAIEKSALYVVCPSSFDLRYKASNFPGKVAESATEETKTYTWQVSNISALRDEPYSPHFEQYLISVKLAPEQFAYRGIKGSFTNWDEYGRWMYENLLKGRDELSESTKAHITDLVKDIPSAKEKARKIYEYMQNKTRYISVQIGIGGFQPYPATEVDRYSYGDCKGLVNYTQALLKVAGINSYYAVVQAGSFKRDILTDFASLNQGNHVILCLPFENDTTWLECTDKFAPFGFLGDFTDDRQVVVCGPQGGRLMRTPKLKTSENRQLRTADFSISKDGSLSGTMITHFEGSQFDNHFVLLNEAYEEQVKKLAELYPLPNLKVEKLTFKQEKEAKPVAIETISLVSQNYCAMNDGKLRLTLNNINRFRSTPKEVRNRANPVYINRGFYDEDRITYHLPEGYKLDFEDSKTVIEKPFGRYSTELKYSTNKILYTRKMQLNEGTYHVDQYPELVDFFQAVIDADSRWLSLSR